MNQINTAIILCGGKGTRLGSAGKKIPKTLIKIQGKPILWYILKFLKKNNFNHIILPIGFKGTQITKYLKNSNEFKNLNLEIKNTGQNTTIANRIYKIKKLIRSENFLLLNGDAIIASDFKNLFQKHKKNKTGISFICSEAEANFGTVETNKGKIVNFSRGVKFTSIKKDNENLTGFVYSGLVFMNKKILNNKFKNKKNFEKEFYPKIIKKYKSRYFKLKGFWYAMDDIKQINYANNPRENLEIFNKIKKIKKNYDK